MNDIGVDPRPHQSEINGTQFFSIFSNKVLDLKWFLNFKLVPVHYFSPIFSNWTPFSLKGPIPNPSCHSTVCCIYGISATETEACCSYCYTFGLRMVKGAKDLYVTPKTVIFSCSWLSTLHLTSLRLCLKPIFMKLGILRSGMLIQKHKN